jgi:hypothetical protein
VENPNLYGRMGAYVRVCARYAFVIDATQQISAHARTCTRVPRMAYCHTLARARMMTVHSTHLQAHGATRATRETVRDT